MANSRFEYVRQYEQDDSLLKNCWLVVRIDGHNFHAFSEAHKFEKPNDIRALELMNHCAKEVMKQCGEIVIAIGESDEYSFVLKRDTTLYSRRSSKIATFIASTFSAHYVFYWSRFFPKTSMQYPVCFDGRVICYPSNKNVRDYLSWRQTDCHINNLYNTCFWNLVLKSNYTHKEAEAKLAGSGSDKKNELLFNDYKINYNQLPAIFRRGSILLWTEVSPDDGEGDGERSEAEDKEGTETGRRVKRQVSVIHEDLINQDFYERYPGIIPSLSRGQIKKMKKKALRPGAKDASESTSEGGTKPAIVLSEKTTTVTTSVTTSVATVATGGRQSDGKKKATDVHISIDRVSREEVMFTPVRTTPGGPTPTGPMPKDSPYHPIASGQIEGWRGGVIDTTPYAMMTTGAFQSSTAICGECRKSGLTTTQCTCKTSTQSPDSPPKRTGEVISDTNYSRMGGSEFSSKSGTLDVEEAEPLRRPSFQAALQAAVGARMAAAAVTTAGGVGGAGGAGAGGAGGDAAGPYGLFGSSAFGRDSSPTATATPASTPSLSRQSSDIDIDIEKKGYYLHGTRLAAEELLKGKPHGTFLFRICNDKKEFIDNKPNPNLFVLCYSRPPKKMVNIKVWRYPGSGLGQKKDPLQCVVYPTVAMLLHALVDQPQSPIAEPT